jgi:XTP/dITP diphosphohydrolase
MDLLLGTTNAGKLAELKELLSDAPFKLVSPQDCGLRLEIAEDGATYEENARVKAFAYAKASGLWTLADDSGLEVDALNGEPGTRSSRYAGEGAQDADKVKLLLSIMKDVPWEKRTARFRCVMAIARPRGEVNFAYGECHGIIALSPEGHRGFGYDPIFYFPEFAQTMAELSEKVKNVVSHRAVAARQAVSILQEISRERNGG